MTSWNIHPDGREIDELRRFVTQHGDHAWADPRLELRVNRARGAIAAYQARMWRHLQEVGSLDWPRAA